jgi:transcriptional regulator with XRE-family HTH domain
MSPEDAAAFRKRKREAMIRRRNKKHKEWLAAGNVMPKCKCGCGETVQSWRNDGTPAEYLFNHHMKDPAIQKKHREQMEAFQAAQREDRIDIESFREACRKIKAQRGWTWNQMADEGGLSHGHFSSLMHSKDEIRKSVSRDWATDFFRRLTGLPAPPSSYQKRKFDAEIAAEAAVDSAMDKEDWSGHEEAVYREKNRLREARRRDAIRLANASFDEQSTLS